MIFFFFQNRSIILQKLIDFTSIVCVKRRHQTPGLINLSNFYFHSFIFALFCYRLYRRSFVKMDIKELQ